LYDPRNADTPISINGELKHRDQTPVSGFESGYLLGEDGSRVRQL